MNILDQIVARKFEIIEERKKIAPYRMLSDSEHFSIKGRSLVERLNALHSSGIIAEFKRKSPSKGIINANASVNDVTSNYRLAGAAGLSILTDTDFFGGSTDDLVSARAVNRIPILRKDFIVDEYQVYETKAMGADVMLLIAECLTAEKVRSLARLAKTFRLEVIMEIHSEEQLDKYTPDIDIIGVNNRNLKTFEVSIEQSKQLFDKLPDDAVKISESGISSVEAIKELREVGYKGFLIGENFMKTDHPGFAAEEFIKQL